MVKITSNQADMTEEWRPIVGYEKYYEVSNFGRIRSLDRIEVIKSPHGGMMSRTRRGKELSPRMRRNGYLSVQMCGENMSRFEMSIHRAVAIAFIQNPNKKKTVNHKDRNRSNNILINLEWATHKENLAHSPHSNSGSSWKHLSAEKVKEIRTLNKEGKSNAAIAKILNVSDATIARIVNRVTFKNI